MTADTQAQGDLAPCPFCNAAPKVGYHGDDDGGYYYVECRACCRPAGLEAERFVGVHAETQLDAIAAWNGRAQEGEPSEVLAALKGMQRFWGKYPSFVYAPEYREQAYAAVDAMNAALAQASRVEIGEAK